MALRLTEEQALEAVTACMDKALEDPTGVFSAPFAHLRKAKGKLLRAKLGIRAALGEDGCVPDALPPRLAAIELLHLATLIHDDLLDGAETRRGIASLPAAFDGKTAVLAGDFLLTRCFSLCLPAGEGLPADAGACLSFLSAAMARLCRGEMLQQRNRYNYDLTLRAYLRIIAGKTGALFALAALTGAYTAGRGPDIQRQAAGFGGRMGMLFQMRDDHIDLYRAPAAGKDTGADLQNGVVTLPVILAFAAEPRLLEAARRGQTEEVLARVRRQVPVNNPVVCRYRRRAEESLARLQGLPGCGGLKELLGFADPARFR
mgnify:CR=1 FL=1